jgi:predicted dithiol-disulfide oxidoreductase (DUF899 family)
VRLIRTKAANKEKHETPCWPEKSNCGTTLSATANNGALCQPAVPCRGITFSPARTAPLTSLSYLVTNKRLRSITRDYLSADDADRPTVNVFTREGGRISHFWSGEAGSSTAEPGQGPRGAPDLMPLWTILDCTREGRSV